SVFAGKRDISVGSPLKEYDDFDDFDQIDFTIVSDQNEVVVSAAKDDVSGSKRKLPAAFEVLGESSKVQKFTCDLP
ncbi:hypothetical protein L195_g056094, partial [Trifolium pratense]